MYSDQTLTPKEAVRLCVLGHLCGGQVHYGALATSVMEFVGALQGPSLDVMGTSLELLKYEGLIEAREGVGMEDDALLALTDAGRDEFETLLTARVRATPNEHNQLIIALKFRFLHLLDEAAQKNQADLLIEAFEGERERVERLRSHASAETGHLNEWMAVTASLSDQRLEWLRAFRESL